MGRFSSGVRTAVGSSSLPIASLYSPANSGGRLMEVHVFNTTAVAIVGMRLMRLTTAGTKPAAVVDGEYDEEMAPALMGFHGTHTVGPTLGQEFKRLDLGASIGSGIIWTFGSNGLVIPAGITNGIGLVPVGAGQICDATFDWEE